VSLLARWLVGAGLVLGIALASFGWGHSRGSASNEAKWQTRSAKDRTEAAAMRAKALDNVVARELARTAQNEDLEQRIVDYEATLAMPSTPAPAGDPDYRLRPADVERLRLLQR
jgi:hypothetical protein